MRDMETVSLQVKPLSNQPQSFCKFTMRSPPCCCDARSAAAMGHWQRIDHLREGPLDLCAVEVFRNQQVRSRGITGVG
jgi:hypothetical protein